MIREKGGKRQRKRAETKGTRKGETDIVLSKERKRKAFSVCARPLSSPFRITCGSNGPRIVGPLLCP